MNRAEETLLKEMRYIASISNGQVKRVADGALASVSEYLATEPSGDRASLLRRANTSVAALDSRIMEPFYCALDQDASRVLSDCIDMLEADAQPKQVTCQIYGHVVGACVECNTHIEAQQAKRVPLTAEHLRKLEDDTDQASFTGNWSRHFARLIEAHHGITPADKPTVDEPEDLYALALKADNWGQP